MLFTFRRLEVRRGPILKSRPWRDGPQAIAILERSDHLEMAENRLEKPLQAVA
jgi:hypothetical protein